MHNTSIKKKNRNNLTNLQTFILDEIGPINKTITENLPSAIVTSIFGEYCHYLCLVAETGCSEGGEKLLQLFEKNKSNCFTESLESVYEKAVNIPDINNCNISSEIEFWINLSAILEFGKCYDDLIQVEKKHTLRFEYLQELNHFSEIMDLSMLTKHIGRVVSNIPTEKRKTFLEEHKELIEDYIRQESSTKQHFKPIAGRNKHTHLGLERMLNDVFTKRSSVHGVTCYPPGIYSKNESQIKIRDPLSVGLTRSNYPYISAILTSNSVETELSVQTDLINLIRIYESFLLYYGIERGTAMLDGYIYDNNYSKNDISLVGLQIFKTKESDANQVKIISVGPNVVILFQRDGKIKSSLQGNNCRSNFLGHTGSTHHKSIITIDEEQPIHLLIAPAKYGLVLEEYSIENVLSELKETNNRLAALQRYGKMGKVPKGQKSIMSVYANPFDFHFVERPIWSDKIISNIDEFKHTKKTIDNYLEEYKQLEINILCGHLHADSKISINQLIAMDTAELLRDKFQGEGKVHFRIMPLIDNLHVKDTFDYIGYMDLMEKKCIPAECLLTEDSALIERIGYDILRTAIRQDKQGYNLIYDKNKSMSIRFPDRTLVQLVNNINLGGILACVPFDLAQTYYRQNPELFEEIFKQDILINFSKSELANLFRRNPCNSYHQIMYEEVYSSQNIRSRNERKLRMFDQVRIPFNELILDNKTPYTDALEEHIIDRETHKGKKVITLYILEGSYDAQFDRYCQLHRTIGIKGTDTYRLTFNSENTRMKLMSNIKG